jgi:pilus assembly protein Flp/PilA
MNDSDKQRADLMSEELHLRNTYELCLQAAEKAKRDREAVCNKLLALGVHVGGPARKTIEAEILARSDKELTETAQVVVDENTARARKLFGSFPDDRKGVTAMEYALIASLIALVIVGSLTTMGKSLTTTFSKAASGFTTSTK